ncbi:hypothetical protein ACOSQ4_013326 [Xanthoceras sorbifolium]
MVCTDEQRVLFSGFLIEDRAKDWWEALERRHQGRVTCAHFRWEFTNRFFQRSHKDARVEEFFKLEQKSMSVTDYEEKFSDLVQLVPFTQEDEEQRCKRFMAGVNPRIKIHLSLAPQTHYGDLVEAAMKVERNAIALPLLRGDPITNATDPVPPRVDSVRLVERKVRQNGLVAKEHTGQQHSARDQLGLLQHLEVPNLHSQNAVYARGDIQGSVR